MAPLLGLIIVLSVAVYSPARAAPYAAMVMDARTGEVLHSRNADTRLHPASLTKMMTLYIAFEAVRLGEIDLDTQVRISAPRRGAAVETRSARRLDNPLPLPHPRRRDPIGQRRGHGDRRGDLGLRGRLRPAHEPHRARARHDADDLPQRPWPDRGRPHVHGARHDASGAAAGLRLSPVLQHLLPAGGHAGIAQVRNTNRHVLNAYAGADGIKTGYTRAAGFNLVASAQRGQERIIATVFGGRSAAWRNQRIMELLDMGFARAPSNAPLRVPGLPQATTMTGPASDGTRANGLVARSLGRSRGPWRRPNPRSWPPSARRCRTP
jgi:D-alanyl-D-alanine carboxypeptidase